MTMQYLVSAEEMKRYDNYTIEEIGIPSMVLMERAALSVVASMREHLGELHDKRILVVCGGGNNGGDGLAVARMLLDLECIVDVVLLATEEKCTEQTRIQLKILKSLLPVSSNINLYTDGQKMLPILESKEYAIIIDAIFGVGLSRPVEGEYKNWIEMINTSGSYVIAVDIPSGIDADLGRCMGCAVKADLTVTFAFAKRGLYLYPGKEYAGEVDCKQIGITAKSFDGKPPVCFTYPRISTDDKTQLLEKVSKFLPQRNSAGNKGTFGKLLVIAGSKDMCGACLLCAESAYRIGAGMVKIVTVEANREIVQTSFPEAMLLTYAEEKIPVQALLESFKWADGVVIGPGIGLGKSAEALLELVLKEVDCPLVIDADALNLLAANEELKSLLKARKAQLPGGKTVLTPHQGELARLTGKTIVELKEEPLIWAKELAERLGCVVVSKDASTIVCDADEAFFLNTAGNSGMATAGSGDVLAGILGCFLVQKQERCNSMLEWVAKGVFLHACAGDLAKERVGEHAMLAGDLIQSLKEISKERK